MVKRFFSSKIHTIIVCILLLSVSVMIGKQINTVVHAQVPTNPWVGLFLIGAPNSAFLWKKDIDCPVAPNGAPLNGPCDYGLTSPTDPGTYEFRFFVNGLLVQKSEPFTVIPITPTASITGPTTIAYKGNGTYTAQAEGEHLDKMVIMRARKEAFIQYETNWKQLGEVKQCGGAISCSVEATWTPPANGSETGPWYVMVKAWDANKTQCSGNPSIVDDGPWKSPEKTAWYNCGGNDVLTVMVQGEGKQTPSVPKGSNFKCVPDPECVKGNNNLQMCKLICTPK